MADEKWLRVKFETIDVIQCEYNEITEDDECVVVFNNNLKLPQTAASLVASGTREYAAYVLRQTARRPRVSPARIPSHLAPAYR
ncbi:unnamed protein product, partial [Iphiclides podalirius]